MSLLDRIEARRKPSIVHVSLGSDRYVENPEPMPEKRPLGFVQEPVHAEPELWEGDNA